MPALVRGRTFADVIDDLRWTNFLLAYQGEDDRELQARFAASWLVRSTRSRRNGARQPRPSATGARIRVGFASAFFSDGTCGRYFRSWIAGLDRARFEIFVYHLRRDATPFLQELVAACRPRRGRFRDGAGAVGDRADDPRRRARRARLSGARDGRAVVRAGRAAAGAACSARRGAIR